MATARDAGLGEVLERLHAASLELTRLHDVSDITEKALAWALDLTRSSVAFINLTGDSDSADTTFVLSADGRRYLPHQEVDRLLHAGTGETSLVHVLSSAGQELGVAGVSRQSGYTQTERSCFSVLANQLSASLAALTVHAPETESRLKVQLERRTEELARLVERLKTVDAARQALLKNVVTAQDKAARRFAGELHDDALQKLTAAELHLKRLEPSVQGDAPGLAEVQSLLEQTEESLRRLLFEVRPPALETPGGLETTIRERLSMVKALTDAEVVLELELPGDLAYEMKSMVFRQVAEALANVEKHARARRVEVSLRLVDGSVHGVIADDGQGFVVEERNNVPGHLGLLSLRERAILAGGWYKIDSRPGGGTRIEFGLPLA